jgi:hypothetical protein
MMLALATLATFASAADHLKASATPGRKLHSTPQIAAGRKLAAAQATQGQTCDWIYGNQYCPGGTQFNCCAGETNNQWTNCGVYDNNYVCPSNRPKAVCCWAK